MSSILFLSSDPVLRQKNMEILTQSGLAAVGAADCLQGLIEVDKNGFDIVVIDEELADVGGYEACVRVRQHSNINIILLGSVSESEVWSKVEELGFDLYLKKPVSPRELLARIKAILRRPVVERIVKPATGERKGESRPMSAPSQPAGSKPVMADEGLQKKTEPSAPKKESLPPIQVVPPLYAETPSPGPSAQKPEVSYPMKQKVQPSDPYMAFTSPSQVGPAPGFGEAIPVQAARPEIEPEPPVDQNVIEDARTIKLIDALVSGKIPEITPEIDMSLPMGFAYPMVSDLLGTSDQYTLNILEALAKNEILIKKPFEKLYMDPDGSFQVVSIERCPRCDSGELYKGQLVEHFSCGYVGLDREFNQSGRYVCAKCHKDMRLIGTDYRNVGIHYRCSDCGEIFTTPVVKWRNLKTRKIWNSEELKEVTVYSYAFSPDKKGWLEFQLKPKTQLVEFLRQHDYHVQELVQMSGSSGAKYLFDIMAVRDDILTKIIIGLGILVAQVGENEVGLEELFRFDSRAYDVGINYKVVIAIPKLAYEASNFAKRQAIRVFEAKTLASLVSNFISQPKPKNASQVKFEADIKRASSSTDFGPGNVIARFLRSRGYEVFERAQIRGKSGVEHVFSIFARRDDTIIAPTIGIEIATSSSGQPIGVDEISQFDAAAFDSGIRNKVFVGIPEVGVQARQFAAQQKINIFELQDLNKLM